MSDLGSWSADAIAGEPIAAFDAMERAITVDLIATFEPKLVCCAPTDDVEDLMSKPDYADFDHLPVQSDGRIVGLLALREFRDCAPHRSGGTVEHVMRRLDQSILIASGTGVLRYIDEIEEAEESPCRLVIRDTRIAGIVTLSDLQKLPVRPALFLRITHLELLMAAVIRARFRDREDDAWLALLGSRRRECVEADWQTLKCKNLAIDRITATQFADKRQILIASDLLQCNRRQAKDQFESIEHLRNSLAHAGDYAATVENAWKTIKRVKLTQRWIEDLQKVLSSSGDTAQAMGHASGK